jgi:hypothetical protein
MQVQTPSGFLSSPREGKILDMRDDHGSDDAFFNVGCRFGQQLGNLLQ